MIKIKKILKDNSWKFDYDVCKVIAEAILKNKVPKWKEASSDVVEDGITRGMAKIWKNWTTMFCYERVNKNNLNDLIKMTGGNQVEVEERKEWVNLPILLQEKHLWAGEETSQYNRWVRDGMPKNIYKPTLDSVEEYHQRKQEVLFDGWEKKTAGVFVQGQVKGQTTVDFNYHTVNLWIKDKWETIYTPEDLSRLIGCRWADEAIKRLIK